MINVQQISVAAYGAQTLGLGVKSTGQKNTPPVFPKTSSEQVQLSDTSITLQKLHDVINSMPDVRIPKVDEIRQKIQENGYPIESAVYKAVNKLVQNKILA